MNVREFVVLLLNEDGVTLDTEVVFHGANTDEISPNADFISMELDDVGNLVVYHSGDSEA